MTLGQELCRIMRNRGLDAVCLGGVCYVRLDGGLLAKAEFTSDSGYYDGLRLTVLNPRTGPVDSLTIHGWELARRAEKPDSCQKEDKAWDVCRPVVDMDTLSEMAEGYLRIFQESDSETR